MLVQLLQTLVGVAVATLVAFVVLNYVLYGANGGEPQAAPPPAAGEAPSRGVTPPAETFLGSADAKMRGGGAAGAAAVV